MITSLNNTNLSPVQVSNLTLLREKMLADSRPAISYEIAPDVPFARIPCYLWKPDDARELSNGLLPQAVGVFAFLLSQKAGFASNETHIIKRTAWSRGAVSRALENLQQCGLVFVNKRVIKQRYTTNLLRVATHPLRVFRLMVDRKAAGQPVCEEFFNYMRAYVLPSFGLNPDAAAPPPPGDRVFVEDWQERWGRYVRFPAFLTEAGLKPRLVCFIAAMMNTGVQHGYLRLATAAAASGLCRKTATRAAKELREAGILRGYPNLYRTAGSDQLPEHMEGQTAKLYVDPEEISANLAERSENDEPVDIRFWTVLAGRFSKFENFSHPEVFVVPQNPGHFDTSSTAENPGHFDTQGGTFQRTNDEVHDKEEEENPKSFVRGQRTFLFSSESSPSSVSSESKNVRANGKILDPLAGTWETPQPEMDHQLTRDIETAYRSQTARRYGEAPVPLRRYTHAACLAWCKDSPLVAAFFKAIGRDAGYRLRGKEAVLLYRRAVSGLLSPALVDRMLLARWERHATCAAFDVGCRRVTGNDIRQFDNLTRQLQACELAVVIGLPDKIDNWRIQAWWDKFCAYFSAEGMTRTLINFRWN